MTESTDTITNYSESDCDNDDYPIDLFVVPTHQQEHIYDEFGLFDDDDHEDNLTFFDLKSIPKSDHDLSIFDELAHQCDAVLLSTNLQQKTAVSKITNNNSYSSNLIPTIMINDYERRFQRSLQKLTIPSWYMDIAPSPKLSNKPSIISTSHYNKESHRTPEIIHVHRPHSYRPCRSSLGTSPSPSIHSWHVNHMMDGMNFSPLLPSSSSSSRQHHKYEKGIERVTKSTHWYQPTQFVAKNKTDQIGTSNASAIDQEKSEYNHYDIPKFHSDDNDNLSNNIKQNLTSDKSLISRLSIKRQSNCLIDDIDFDDAENTRITMQNKINDKSNNSVTYDKQQDNHIQSNEFKIMPLTNDKMSFGRVELEEIADEEENDKRSSTNNIHIPSTVEEYNDDDTNTSLELVASNLVDSILNDVLLLKNFDHNDDDTNTGVRELSDDENGLRELDENDMSGTDEFIVFATKAEAPDDDDDDDHENNTNTNNQQSPTIVNRGSLNRLYTFSRTNDDNTINNSKKLPSNQDSLTSILMIVDKDISTTNTDLIPPVNIIDDSNDTNPIYRSHIQKRHINLGRYYDGMMRGKNSQLPTHDLRCNLSLNNKNQEISPEGVTEETVRKGRILLDSIPNAIELKNELNENIHKEEPIPIRPILKNTTRFALTDDINDKKVDDQILKIEEIPKTSPRKIITTITEEYHRIQRKIIEEFDEEVNEKVFYGSDYSNNQERIITQQSLIPSVPINDQSPYELLSECYSGYSFIQNNFLTPIKAPLLSNVSSLQTTTDEAYESERTTSPRSPIMNSSIPAHIHPDLKHEFEYPSPPPPVPDRRLKPAHLRPPPPPTKPRSHKQQQKDSNVYSKIERKSIASPLAAIQHLLVSTTNDSTSSSVRTMSSRHFCGSLPVSNEPITSSSNIKTDEYSKQNSKKLSNSSTNDNNNQQIIFKKSPSASLNKTRAKKTSSAYFDEATNGLPIRLPASVSNGHESTDKQNLNRTSTPSSTKRADGTTKTRPISENINLDRSSAYETSV